MAAESEEILRLVKEKRKQKNLENRYGNKYNGISKKTKDCLQKPVIFTIWAEP